MTTLDLRGPLLTVHTVGNISTPTADITDHIDLSLYTYVKDHRSNECLAGLGLTFSIGDELTKVADSSDSQNFN